MIILTRDQTTNHGGSFSLVVTRGKKFIVPRWIEVSMETEMWDVQVESLPEPPRVETPEDREWTFIGSKGNKYTVARKGGDFTCTCPASMFQKFKDCKHITEAKSA
jgi:hypothetical protein